MLKPSFFSHLKGHWKPSSGVILNDDEILRNLVVTKEYAKLIKDLREKAGKSREEMAQSLGISSASYSDLELDDKELLLALSLRTIEKMCDIFGIGLIDLLADDKQLFRLPAPLSFEQLVEMIKVHMAARGMTRQQFEDECDWYLPAHLADPETIWNQPVMFLQDVCRCLGLDWLAVVPRYH